MIHDKSREHRLPETQQSTALKIVQRTRMLLLQQYVLCRHTLRKYISLNAKHAQLTFKQTVSMLSCFTGIRNV